MKKLFTLILIVVFSFTLLVFTACKKSDAAKDADEKAVVVDDEAEVETDADAAPDAPAAQ
jgi:ABC-type oligopeptide transport system substrate-binding subunit